MRASTAFFAGAGTVIVAIAAGLGGGMVMGNIMSPQQGHHAFSRFERRATPSQSPRPWPSVTAKSAGVPVPYLAAAEKIITTPMVVPPSTGAAQRTATAESRPDSAAKAASATPNVEAGEADLKRLDETKRVDRSAHRRQWAARRVQQDQRDVDDQDWNDGAGGNEGWDNRKRWGHNRGRRGDRGGSREIIVRRDPEASDRRLFGSSMRFDFPRFNLLGAR